MKKAQSFKNELKSYLLLILSNSLDKSNTTRRLSGE